MRAVVAFGLSLAALSTALPGTISRRQTPPPPGKTYITARPACNITGFTEIPGNYTETIHSTNTTLLNCIVDCRANSTCKSIAYAAEYTECLWYDHYVNETQLWSSLDSPFDHFDEQCDVCQETGGFN